MMQIKLQFFLVKGKKSLLKAGKSYKGDSISRGKKIIGAGSMGQIEAGLSWAGVQVKSYFYTI